MRQTSQTTGSFAEHLHEAGHISQDAYNIILTEAGSDDTNAAVRAVLNLQLLAPYRLAALYFAYTGIQSADLRTTPIAANNGEPSPSKNLGEDMAIIDHCQGAVWVAMDAPSHEAISRANARLGYQYPIMPLLALPMRCAEAKARAGQAASIRAQLATFSSRLADDDAHPAAMLVESLLAEAVMQNASDLHFAMQAGLLQHSNRVDGVLQPQRTLHPAVWEAVKTRLKVMARVDITEHRLPQDGAFSVSVFGKAHHFRFSSMPTIAGETVVVRSHGERAFLSFDALGLSDAQRTILTTAMAEPSGLILIAGPTGSGKTATLYALLSLLSLAHKNVMTLEDPAEQPVSGLRQTNVRPDIGLGFAEGIRAMLRQDPDVLLIGEIRDEASAQLALRAALTGHLVLATLHAADIREIPDRLNDLCGQHANFLSQTLVLMAQRLLRKTCFYCQGAGCAHCLGTGFLGRQGIFEVMAIGKEARPLPLVYDAATPTLADAARKAVADGWTTNAEVRRALGAVGAP